MRCKIIKISSEDCFFNDSKRLLRKKGVLNRVTANRGKWLSGGFNFDDPYQQGLVFYQIHVEPIEVISNGKPKYSTQK